MAEEKQTIKGDGPIINFLSTNRAMLVHCIDEIIKDSGEPAPPIYLKVERADCGCVFTWSRKEDLPERSLQCAHGHWLIKYTEDK